MIRCALHPLWFANDETGKTAYLKGTVGLISWLDNKW